MNEDMQTLIQQLRKQLSGKTEPEAINFLADKLNMSLLGIRVANLTSDQQTALVNATALVYLIKEMTIQLARS